MIATLHIENFRAHECLDIEFTPNQALVGPNGTGKTAVLEALDYLFSIGSIAGRVSESDFHNLDKGPILIRATLGRAFLLEVPDGFNSQKLLGQAVELSISRRKAASPGRALSDPWVVTKRCIPILYNDRADIDKNIIPDEVKLEELAGSVAEVEAGYQITRKAGSVLKVRRDRLGRSMVREGFPNVFYFGRHREKQLRTGFGTLLTRMAKDLNWRYRKAEVLPESAEKWEEYYRVVLSSVEGSGKTKLLQSLRELASRLTGMDFGEFEIGLLQLEHPFSRAFLGTRSGTNQIELQQMGSGISLAVTLCMLEQISLRSKAEVIFLIDEPELHLHPQLQRAFSDHLRGTGVQLICATHSPAFIDLSKVGSITRLSRDHSPYPDETALDDLLDGVSIRQHLAEISKYYLHRTVYQEQDAKLFFADDIILVEGAAEEFGLPTLALLSKLDLRGVTLMNCRGKPNIPHFALLCRAYKLRFFTIFDLDGKPESDAENVAVDTALGGAPRFCFENSFEEALGIYPKARHKASLTMSAVDALNDVGEVPAEVANALSAIAAWVG
jgi:hypothetical protein